MLPPCFIFIFTKIKITMNITRRSYLSRTRLILTLICCASSLAIADTHLPTLPSTPYQKPVLSPTPPNINAKAYILIDVDSRKIIAEKNSQEKLPPASLTKMMTLYVISKALDSSQIQLTDPVRISKQAWQTGGSRMFVREGQEVPVEDLLKGIIVASGNDACIAMSEHLGGTEKNFTEMMNQQAKSLGMNDSHFEDSTGLPSPNHYSTAQDLATLGRALIKEFPQYYHWYKQKWFTFNDIRQPNRNRLLWRNLNVDGIKTGQTDKAGYCLVSSAENDGMRLLAVVLNSPNDTARTDDSERLLNYGFRFFETHKLYPSSKSIATLPIYKAKTKQVQVGPLKEQYITLPKGQYERITLETSLPKYLVAPIDNSKPTGEVLLKLDGHVIATQPLYVFNEVSEAGWWKRTKDSVKLMFKRWFS